MKSRWNLNWDTCHNSATLGNVHISLNLHKLHQVGLAGGRGMSVEPPAVLWTPPAKLGLQLLRGVGSLQANTQGVCQLGQLYMSTQTRLDGFPSSSLTTPTRSYIHKSYFAVYFDKGCHNAGLSAIVINCSLISNAIQTLTLTLIWMIVASLYM